MDGILIIDKPPGFTSHDVVARARRILKTKSIGHTGTLDPFATGVMVLLVGKATRLAQFLDKDVKEYEALVQLGAETTTGDRTGELKNKNYELKHFSDDEIEAALAKFRGTLEQTPPMYSAKKIAGKKLYELARQGVEIERRPVAVTIYELAALKSQIPNPQSQIRIRVSCSAGTYIRTLAEDIGKALGTGAHLAELRRTRAGKFDLAQAVTLEKLEELAAQDKLAGVLISMRDALAHLPEKILDESELKKVCTGMRLYFEAAESADEQAIRLTDADGNLAAIGIFKKRENFIQPKIVLV